MTLKAWISAARLRTLPLAVSSIVMGTACAIQYDSFDGFILFLALLTTICLQVLSNFANDYGDALSGKDNEERIGPKRMVSSGIISSKRMKKAMIIMSGISFMLGVILIVYAFSNLWITLSFLIVGVLSIVAAIKYTVGKNPYGYVGLGDLFVFLFFGIVGVGGSFFLYANTFHILILLPSVSIGLLSTSVLTINNMRDIENDQKTGKNTLAVQLGLQRTKTYYSIITMLAFTGLIVYAYLHEFRNQQYLWLVVVPLFAQNIRKILSINDPSKMDPFLKKTALGTFVLTLLFIASILFF